MSGRLVFLLVTVTSSAMAKWLAAGFFQSIRWMVAVCLPTPGLTRAP